MIDDATALTNRERRIARRLARLFRIERAGRLERYSRQVIDRFLDRRGQLVDEMLDLEKRRRSLEPWTPNELALAMGALAKEIDRAEEHCLARLAGLGSELERRRRGVATGLRDTNPGRLLGQG